MVREFVKMSREDRDSDMPEGGPEWMRWMVYLYTRVGIVTLFIAFLCWHQVKQENSQTIEREQFKNEVVTAFKECTRAIEKQSEAIYVLASRNRN